MKINIDFHELVFRFEAGTSRGVMTKRPIWILHVTDENERTYLGECAPLKGLSIEDNFKEKLETLKNADFTEVVKNLAVYRHNPSILFALESLQLAISNQNNHRFVHNEFTQAKKGIGLNGLIWMGDIAFMKKQIADKIEQHYKVIKLKIGANNLDDELRLLSFIRTEYGNDIEIRLDANGAFTANEALEVLKKYAAYNIHSIEQPIKVRQWNAMASLCSKTPIPIALDEELIGIYEEADKQELLQKIKPQYIILKPSLHGGIAACNEWIKIAKENAIGYWITSALESNIGLNVIAQYTSLLNNNMVHGLGTGALFENNFPSHLYIKDAQLWYSENSISQ